MTNSNKNVEDRLCRHYESMTTYQPPEPVGAAGWKGRAGVVAAVAGMATVRAVGWQEANKQDLATVTPASEANPVASTTTDRPTTSLTIPSLANLMWENGEPEPVTDRWLSGLNAREKDSLIGRLVQSWLTPRYQPTP